MFLNNAKPILNWLPNETLYSLCSRQYALWGDPRPSSLNCELFGANRLGWHHDLPNGLGYFTEVTGGHLGDVREIAINRTLLAYYHRFLTPLEEVKFIEQMSGSCVKNLKYQMGLLTSRFRANHPLKACEACIEEDIECYGWPYWHIQHQYPGVWTCFKHGTLLGEFLEKSTGVARFQWRLPDPIKLRVWPNGQHAASSEDLSSVKKLSTTITSIVNMESLGSLNNTSLLDVYRVALDNRGWLTANGRLRLQEIALTFLDYTAKLKFIPEFRALPDSVDAAVEQAGRLLRPLRSGTHPIRHLLLIDWLFDDVNQFEQAWRSGNRNVPEQIKTKSDSESFLLDDNGNRKKRLIEKLKSSDLSIRAAASDIGVDVQTALVWSAEAGIKIDRRPKKLKQEVKKAILRSLRDGLEKTGIAIAYDISIPTVNRLLRSEPEVLKSWNSKRKQQILKTKRRIWLNLLCRHQYLGMKLMRAEAPSVYTWLYRHDKSWLESHKPEGIAISHGRRPAVHWDKRDYELNREIQKAGLALLKSGNSRIFLWQLYQCVPELKAKLDVLSRLPVTLKTINYLLDWRRKDGWPQFDFDV